MTASPRRSAKANRSPKAPTKKDGGKRKSVSTKRNASKPLTYEGAGVSIAEGDALVARLAKSNRNIGGFSGAFPLDVKGMKRPVLLASTDGVGTKLLIAQQLRRIDTIGIDLVAMVINDLLVAGARPLFFLDYYATGKLTAAEGDAVLAGIRAGCEEAGIPLLGGETAEMPGMYAPGHFDLAGFGVGVADKSRLIDGSAVKPGDAILGIASSGIHSNGYSLVRAAVERAGLSLGRRYAPIDGKLGEVLLRPTRIYARAVAALLRVARPTAMAHVTGGGLEGNLVRVLPANARAVIDAESWEVPPIFGFLAGRGGIETAEMRRVFNMGIGYVVVCREKDAAKCLGTLRRRGEQAWRIGKIVRGRRGTELR